VVTVYRLKLSNLPIECVYVFGIILEINSDYFPKRHQQLGLYHRRNLSNNTGGGGVFSPLFLKKFLGRPQKHVFFFFFF